MILSDEQQSMLAGELGYAAQKAMQILTALASIYGAQRLVPVTSVQISGVSYDNLGEAGLEFLEEMAAGGGRARVLTTPNPAGMDVDNWQALGIDPAFAANQQRVIDAFTRMGVSPTCSCTPYLIGNRPSYGEHIAWAESSAVCYANAVLGARTNREGGPSALAAALTGVTPAYGLHLDENRAPSVCARVETSLSGSDQFGALGQVIGARIQAAGKKPLPYIQGIPAASLEELKSFCASLATYAGAALFHMEGLTPEAKLHAPPADTFAVTAAEINAALAEMTGASSAEVDFVSLGCPHLSLDEIARIAGQLRGRKVTRVFWITTARPVKQQADALGYTQIIEESGALFATDTCCVVAPIQGRLHALATDSAKACYYAAAKNRFKTRILPFDEVVAEALK
jgi:predicted aconitase